MTQANCAVSMGAPSPAALPENSCSPPTRSTTPANPMVKPMVRLSVSRSPGTRKWLSGRTRSGTTAMVMPAKLVVTCCWPHASRLNGIALVNMPMPMQCIQTRRPVADRMVGRPAPVSIATRTSSMAASEMRPVDTQIGSRLSSASSTPRKAPPQITPRKARSPQSSGAGDCFCGCIR